MPDLARRLGIKIIAGPLVSREPVPVIGAEAAKVGRIAVMGSLWEGRSVQRKRNLSQN
jgi:hypothetical protein